MNIRQYDAIFRSLMAFVIDIMTREVLSLTESFSRRITFVVELGYLSLDQQTSNLFYQVISTRHAERRSAVITTNTIFSEWGNILFNKTIAAAIADRLVENSEVFLMGGSTRRNPKNGQAASHQ